MKTRQKGTCFGVMSCLTLLVFSACSTVAPGGSETPADNAVPAENEASAAPSEQESESAPSETSTGNTEVRIMTRFSSDDTQATYFRDKLAEFNASDRGITVIDESISEETAYFDKLRSSIATGNQPEIFIEYGGARIMDYVEAGILLDLQPYLDDDPAWRDAFLDDVFEKWQNFEEYPGTFGIPSQFYAIMLYYNKDLLKENGFDAPPATLDEWRNMCQTMFDNGQLPMSLGEKENWRGGHLLNNLVMKAYGAQGVDDITSRTMNYDDPRMIELYSIIKEFNDKGFFGPNAVGIDVNTEDTDFLTQKTALRFTGTWFIAQITSGFEGDVNSVGVAPFPYINEEFKNSWQGGCGDAFSISDRPETNDAAVEFVKYITNPDYWAGLEARSMGGIYAGRFESLPDVEIDPLTIATKALMAEGKEFRDDIQTYDPESHMIDTARSAIQGLFVGNTPEQCAEEIVSKQLIK